MKRKIFFITGSKHKFEELKEFISDSIDIEMLSIDLPEIQENDAKKIISEKLRKAKILYPEKELIVEDTSLYLDCLNGFPGPLIKWFSKSLGYQKIYDICNKFGNFDASAVCNIGYSHQGKIEFFEGRLKGTIVPPEKSNGFGWDLIFVPENLNIRYSEMSKEDKNKISHRARAAKTFMAHLEKQLQRAKEKSA